MTITNLFSVFDQKAFTFAFTCGNKCFQTGQNLGGQNCRKSGLLPKILSDKEF